MQAYHPIDENRWQLHWDNHCSYVHKIFLHNNGNHFRWLGNKSLRNSYKHLHYLQNYLDSGIYRFPKIALKIGIDGDSTQVCT